MLAKKDAGLQARDLLVTLTRTRALIGGVGNEFGWAIIPDNALARGTVARPVFEDRYTSHNIP